MRDLEGAQHAGAEQLMRLEAGDIDPVEDHRALVGHDIAGHDIEQRGFACPVRADQPGNRAAAHR
ncbi:hypothetical protein FQZ97_1026210 [compost metagenome]